MKENIAIFVISILLAVIGFLFVYVLNDIKKALNKIFNHLENHSARILTCDVEHKRTK